MQDVCNDRYATRGLPQFPSTREDSVLPLLVDKQEDSGRCSQVRKEQTT